jgi:hypothetical protein
MPSLARVDLRPSRASHMVSFISFITIRYNNSTTSVDIGLSLTFVGFVVSFMIVAIFWINRQRSVRSVRPTYTLIPLSTFRRIAVNETIEFGPSRPDHDCACLSGSVATLCCPAL